MRAHHLPLNTAVPLSGVGIGLGCGVGLTAGILFGSAESMLIGAGTGASGGAIADMLSQARGLHRTTLLLLTVPTGGATGALVGIASDRVVSATIAGLIAGLVLGLLFNWIAKPTRGSP